MVYEDKGMSGFYENYVKLMGNLIEPDRATPYKINYLKKYAFINSIFYIIGDMHDYGTFVFKIMFLRILYNVF